MEIIMIRFMYYILKKIWYNIRLFFYKQGLFYCWIEYWRSPMEHQIQHTNRIETKHFIRFDAYFSCHSHWRASFTDTGRHNKAKNKTNKQNGLNKRKMWEENSRAHQKTKNINDRNKFVWNNLIGLDGYLN